MGTTDRKPELKESTLSYNDLKWKKKYLGPLYVHGFKDVLRRRRSKERAKVNKSVVLETADTVTLLPGSKTTKITDCGYDMLSCCYTGISAAYDVELSATVIVERFLEDGFPTYQEGFGLFVRDSMELESASGYPYSNMALAGGCLGGTNYFVRSGVTEKEREEISNFSLKKRSSGQRFRTADEPHVYQIRVKMSGQQLSAEMLDENGTDMLAPDAQADGGEIKDDGVFTQSGSTYTIPIGKENFLIRDKRRYYIGFLVAGNSQIAIRKKSVTVKLTPASAGKENILYVSPEGSPSADGSRDCPFDLETAIARTKGETIMLLPGRYLPESDVVLGSRRLLEKQICTITAESGRREDTVIDFAGKDSALKITGDYWRLEGITVTGGMGIQISGKHNQLERCLSVRNRETGILIRHPDNNAGRQEWPAYNRIESCISCLNMDASECNADGFACKVTAGRGNEFVNCVSFLNSDDGFDLFTKNKSIGAVKLTSCESCLNGYFYSGESGLVQTKGNGTGFKLGGSGIKTRHIVRDCTAQGNKDAGFTSNSNPSITLINCRSLNNQKGNVRFYYSGIRTIPEKIIKGFLAVDDPDYNGEELCRNLLEHYDIETVIQ